MMNIKNKLTARLNRLKAAKSSSQKGLGIGAIILIVILLGAIAYAANKFGGDTASGDKQKLKLDSGTLASQVEQLRTGLALLSSETSIAWTDVANKSGKLSLANATVDYTSTATVPTGPIGADGNPIKWTFGVLGMPGEFRYFAWTSTNLSAALCTEFNSSILGGSGTPLSYTLTQVYSSPAKTLASGNTDAVAINATGSMQLGGFMASNPSTNLACIESGGVYLILARLR